MTKPRRKPRYCRECGRALHTPKTGRWFFCEPPLEKDDKRELSCQEKYIEHHEPDVDPACLLKMRPTDEDNEGVSLKDLRRGNDTKDIIGEEI